jgi:hypothetical protein
LWVTLLTLITLGGIAVAYRWPGAPLLALWLLLAASLGLGISLWTKIGTLHQRLSWLVLAFAVLIPVSLITTQVAARRAISSTHLVYAGVHLAGVDSFTLGSGGSGADVRLETVSSAYMPWLLRLRRLGNQWELEPLSGVEQFRLRQGSTDPIEREFSVARAAVVHSGDSVAILDPRGDVADTLNLVDDGVRFDSGTTLTFGPVDDSLSARSRRRLSRGTSLSSLDVGRVRAIRSRSAGLELGCHQRLLCSVDDANALQTYTLSRVGDATVPPAGPNRRSGESRRV